MDLTKDQINALINCCEKEGYTYSQQEPLEKHTTFRAGGPAELFVHVQNGEACGKLLCLARQMEVPVHILGKGSNLLVSDEGVEGLVLHMDAKQNNFRRNGNEITAWAGDNLSALCMYAWEQQLSGLEFAYGIPGSVGGAVYMNAGAYGGEVKDCLKWVRYLDENLQEIPGIRIYGDFTDRNRCPIVALNVRDYDSGQVSDALSEEYGIATRPGAHCAPLMHKALGTVEQGAVRFSFSHYNTEEEIKIAVSALRELAQEE